jgi:hypothetical protein
MATEHQRDLDPEDHGIDPNRTPVDPDDADQAGFLPRGGGPASIIYGDDEEGEDSGDRLDRAPEDAD